MPSRVQMSRQHPWRKDHPNAVIVARPSKWGNPFPVAQFGRVESRRLYRNYLNQNPDLVAAAREQLAGRDLACWCKPNQWCHADDLITVANSGTADDPPEQETCHVIDDPEGPIVIRGAQHLTPETEAALREVIAAGRRRFAEDDKDGQITARQKAAMERYRERLQRLRAESAANNPKIKP